MDKLMAVRQLVAKWRDEAATALDRWPRGAILPSKKLRQCADELEAAIRGNMPENAKASALTILPPPDGEP